MFVSGFNETLIFSEDFYDCPIRSSMQVRQVSIELFHGEGQTDRHDEDNSRFSELRECTEECTVTVKVFIAMLNCLCIETELYFRVN
jgi:hypothetical protein